MAVNTGVLIFLVSCEIIDKALCSLIQTCVSHHNEDIRQSCNSGCCGNGTLHGWGTLPCCQEKTTPQYAYLLLAIGLLVPCAVCLMILRKAGERCRERPLAYRHQSRRGENLQGAMPGVADRRLMITTIADLIYRTRERAPNPTADIVYPPSYDDVVKEPYDEFQPPEYSEVVKMNPEGSVVTETDGEPPTYSVSDEVLNQTLAIPSTSQPSTSSLTTSSFEKEISSTTNLSRTSSENSDLNYSFSTDSDCGNPSNDNQHNNPTNP